MSNMIALLENAIVARLKDVPRPYAGLLIESYGSQLDDETFAWIRVLPATWVTFGGTQEVKRISQNNMKVRGTFEVLCAQRALVENAGRLNGPSSGADVGVYVLLEDNKLALVNQKLDLPIQPIKSGPIRAVFKGVANREAVVVYAQEFQTEWVETYKPQLASPAGELQKVGMEYYLKPQHTPPVDAPDNTDTITLT